MKRLLLTCGCCALLVVAIAFTRLPEPPTPISENVLPKSNGITFVDSVASENGSRFNIATAELALPAASKIGAYEIDPADSFIEGYIQFATGLNPVMRIDGGDNNNLDIRADGTIHFNLGGQLNITPLQNFPNNATALSNGLVIGDVYRNGDNLCIVH